MALELKRISSRKRRPNWTDQESLLLAQLLLEKKEIIKGKCSTGVSIQDKRQAWEEIAQAFNAAFPEAQRTISDCNKKWENLLAKSRQEIKRKRQAGGLSLEQFSNVTQLVISMMNLSDVLLQQDRDDSSVPELEETIQNSCSADRKDHIADESSNKHPLTEPDLPEHPDPSAPPAKQKKTSFKLPKSLAGPFSLYRAAAFTASAEQQDAPSSASPPEAHSAVSQQRLDLEMSVLRRQEAVLKLQEEYYTMKIQMMKKKMEER